MPPGVANAGRHAGVCAMRRIRLVVVTLLVLGSMGGARGEPLAVVSVSDGDTFTGLDGRNRRVKVRLHGIDAPEKAQLFGTAARKSLGELVMGKVVDMRPLERDDYGRVVADVQVGGISVNQTQVERGYAWRSARYDTRGEFARVELAARQAGRGLWVDPFPVAPWEWRRSEAQRKRAGQAAGRRPVVRESNRHRPNGERVGVPPW